MNFLWLSWSLALMAAPTIELPPTTEVAALATRALDGDARALAELRALGQPGLDVLRTLRAELSSVPPFPSADPRATAWDTLIDRVARQQYATLSGLYWHTDLEAAKVVAQKQGKPILSLRLLGDLDETLSCANSRFFRTLLYPDAAVRAALHDRFVLHWESVRKAPKITIDFGDGRVLTRTVTGNSLHYLLDGQGRVVDALPGLVGPEAFVAWLDRVSPFAISAGRLDDRAFAKARAGQHGTWKADGLARWRDALAAIGVDVPNDADALRAATTEEALGRLAARRPTALRIAPEHVGFFDRIFPTAEEAAPLAITKAAVERPMLPWLRNLRGIIARDEIHNETVLHTAIHDLFDADASLVPEPITRRIYAGVFLTPLDDPFMGLAPADVFTAIPADIERKGDDTGAVFGLGDVGRPGRRLTP
ncbi:MAG: hypothetical protein IT385_23335 [Deltaproteobacteria bacterium]|nr:hypothetical protein [Deltaproteobacteria bacterium]